MKLDMSRRFSFIESRLYWAEGLTASALAEAFGISRQSAQAVVEKYRQLHPGNMQYDEKKKQHVVTEAFMPHYIRAEANLFFAAIRGQNEVCHYVEDVSWSDVPFEDVSRCIKTKINYIPAIMSGLMKKHTVSIYYVSKYRIITRYISPHHLVYADGRYHLRAYCHVENKFLDFVISRIRSASCGDCDDWVSNTDDIEWHQYVTLTFKLNPKLSEATKRAIEEDYILIDGAFSIRCRKALELYVKRQMIKYDEKSQLRIWLEFTNGSYDEQFTNTDTPLLAPLPTTNPWSVDRRPRYAPLPQNPLWWTKALHNHHDYTSMLADTTPTQSRGGSGIPQ